MRDALYGRAQAIAHDLLELAPDLRQARLTTLCGDDAELRREVEWLVSTADDTFVDEVRHTIADATSALAADLRVEPTAAASYRLIERLGEGGMGVVWLAEREAGGARMRVALKRLHPGSVAQHARFQEEQRILGTLNHRNIAHLVDAGEDTGGNPFLAMEFVEGERIDRWCDTHALDLRMRIELFLKVCAAVSYAHERLVIHRDNKPANIVVDAAGEPKLLDFGIARLVDTDATLTVAARAMTVAYASPEQIAGEPLGTSTDLWSLGVVLHELVCGIRLFPHTLTEHALSEAIRSGAVVPPSQQIRRARTREDDTNASGPLRERHVPADVDAIVLKALRREPEQRYASVRDFSEDLQRFLDARPVAARRGRWTYRAQRFVQRYRWLLIAAAASIAIASGFTWRTVLAEREARLQARVAEQAIAFLTSAFSLSDPTRADRHDFSAREVLDRSRDRLNLELADQPRVRARLLEALGEAYRGIDERSTGAQLLEEAARLNLDPAVNNPLAAARSLRSKAISVMSSRGSTAEAASAAQRALDLLADRADVEPLVLADAYGTLAQALNANARESDAMSAALQALSLREAADAGPSAIARSLLDLCTISSGISEHARAVRYCERAGALYVQAGMERSNDRRLVLAQLASTLAYTGEHQKSLAVMRESVALTQSLFGEDSSTFAMSRIGLAIAMADRGDFGEAADLLAQSMPVVLHRNGRSSLQYARALSQAGWIKFRAGEYPEAAERLREALEIHVALVGDEDGDRLQVMRLMLSMTLIGSGDSGAEPRDLLAAVIDVRTQGDVTDVALGYAHLPLAQWHVLRGELDEADRLLDRIGALGQRIEPEMHARLEATRAAILRTRGDRAGALRHGRSAYEISTADVGASHPRTACYALVYAGALRAVGETAHAERIEREYRPRIEAAYPPDSAFRRLLSAGRSADAPLAP